MMPSSHGNGGNQDCDSECDSDDQDPVSAKASLASSQRSLSQDVPEDFIRGIPLRCLLARAGRSLTVPSSTGADATDDRVRSHLRRCLLFDTFISHDWKTARRLKYASLLLFFNAKPAAVATLLVSVTGGVLSYHYEVLPPPRWAISIGYLTFAIFLFFWQNLRDIFRRPRLAFLDKFTIPQEDEEVKERCILGLAGFLTCSRQFLILWSEPYIDRIWCIYELTTFMRLHGGKRPVHAIPVNLPLLLLVHSGWWFAVRLLSTLVYVHTETTMPSENPRLVLVSICLLSLFCITYPFQHYAGTRMTRNLQALTTKLGCFEVQEAKCSCCSQGHMTQSGETIPCDRALIYQSFRLWYGKKGEDMQSGLESFNEAVRRQFRDQILHACGGSRMIPLDLFICVVFSMNTPMLIFRIPKALRLAEQETSALQSCLVATNDLLQWAAVFPSMLVYLWASRIIWSHSQNWHISVQIIAAAVVFFTTLCSGLLTFVSVSRTPSDSGLPLMVFAVLLLLGFCLLDRRCARFRGELPKSSPTIAVEAVEEVNDDKIKEYDSDSFSI